MIGNNFANFLQELVCLIGTGLVEFYWMFSYIVLAIKIQNLRLKLDTGSIALLVLQVSQHHWIYDINILENKICLKVRRIFFLRCPFLSLFSCMFDGAVAGFHIQLGSWAQVL